MDAFKNIVREPIVSVIIPSYNSAAFLPAAIASVLTQSYRHFEIIVVDDGSVDRTRELATSYPVKYIYQQNQGVSAARNRGVSEAIGELVVFLDADDILLPQALEIGVEAITSHPESGFVAGSCQEIDAGGAIISESNLASTRIANYQTLLRGEAFVPPSVLMFRKTAIKSVGGFNNRFKGAEDYDFYLRIARQFPIYCHNQTVTYYRRHDNNASNNAIEMLAGCLEILDLNWKFVRGNRQYERAYRAGRNYWIQLFGPYLMYQTIRYLRSRQWHRALKALLFQLQVYPKGISEYIFAHSLVKFRHRNFKLKTRKI
ncbi:glycosyltransferase [Myxosarcina sp. GI1]|uniref:glycosyltransferase family 2 protein n=1 Tax=Myxosarcina sp. GI1 TaxID=1541065 RepID=UPI0006921597|nr:glycosyltransferase [Myxosarcina sp. GI1]